MPPKLSDLEENPTLYCPSEFRGLIWGFFLWCHWGAEMVARSTVASLSMATSWGWLVAWAGLFAGVPGSPLVLRSLI